MPLDLDNLTPAPDIENFDASAQDRGDAILTTPPLVPEDKGDVVEPDVEDEVETPEPEDDEGEPERNEKGQFASKGIPKARFDEAVGKERVAREQAESRAAQLEQQLAQAQQIQQAQVRTVQMEELEASITQLEERHAELTLDGNTKEAAAVMKQIRLSERQIAKAEAEASTNETVSRALEAERYPVAVARLEADYPELNPDSELYNEGLVKMVLRARNDFIYDGMPRSQAIVAGAKEVMSVFGTKTAPAPAAKGLAAEEAGDRKKAQVAKNLDAQKRQPPAMKDVGMDSDKAGETQVPDASQMTQEEFRALPQSMISRMRGDML